MRCSFLFGKAPNEDCLLDRAEHEALIGFIWVLVECNIQGDEKNKEMRAGVEERKRGCG